MATLLIVAVVTALGACSPGPERAPEGSAELVGTVWRWQGFQDSADGDEASNIDVIDPEKYTLTLRPDGAAHIRADCNRSSWRYTWAGSSLAFDASGPSTLAYCGDESLSERYLERLGHTATYVLTDGALHLNLKLDSGNMVFVAEKATPHSR